MSLLVQEMIKDLLPEGSKKTTAVYGGGFKPPTKGHFEVVTTALKKNSNIDEFIILIGGKERDGITQSDSLLIWEIYKQYLPINVNVITDSKPPIQGVYNYAKEHPNEDVIFVIGAREGNEEDFTDITNRTKSVNNYPNLRVETVVTQGGVSGTAARNAAKVSFEKFRPFVPSELTDEEAREVFDIVSQNIKEILNENASYSNEINIKNEIAKLTKHMINKRMNIKPLPKLIFKNGDSENAKQFLGKTAYYDPNNQSIVLYTEGRHPKDIVRSFAHEMIHHIQNLEGRLGEITTTNTQEDDNLDKLEQEANLKGTMTFRNWTDSLNEAIVGNKIVCDNCGWSWKIADGGDDLYICHKCGYNNTPIQENKIPEIKYTKPNFSNEWEEALRYPEFEDMGKEKWIEIANQGKPESFSKIKNVLGNVDLRFDRLRKAKRERFQQAFEKGVIEMSIAVKFGEGDYDLVAGNTRLAGLVKNGVDPKIWIVDISNLQEQKNKDPFGLNQFARELMREINEKSNYQIYCDMDGVLADFEGGYKELTGIDLQSEFKPEGEKFWDPISKAGIGFWAGLKWMPDGQQLWDYIKKYNPSLLSAPSKEDSSRIGKSVWVKKRMPGTKLILRSADRKKEFASPNSILIDDMKKNIDSWEAAGGIGILHTSASSTINQLKKLGL
jgi:ribosomal protein S27AE